MAIVSDVKTIITLKVEVVYQGKFPLDNRRREHAGRKLQEYADNELTANLNALRYSDEAER